MAKLERQRFTASLRIRAPEALNEALERAADANMTTSSGYIRQAIIARLKSEYSAALGALGREA
jgi:predicted transcriptional regulator